MRKQLSKEELAHLNLFKRVNHGGTTRSVYEGMEIDPAFSGPDGFANFLKEVGLAPGPEYLLDREDNARGYVKGNLRWATPIQSNRNRKGCRYITAFERTQHVNAWSLETGVHRATILRRIDFYGWSPEDAVSKTT